MLLLILFPLSFFLRDLMASVREFYIFTLVSLRHEQNEGTQSFSGESFIFSSSLTCAVLWLLLDIVTFQSNDFYPLHKDFPP